MSDAATTGQTPTDPGTAAPADATVAADQGATLLGDAAAPTGEQQTQQTDAAADGSTDAKVGEADTDAKPQGAPEEYADFSLPDGYTLDAELGGELKTIAKELNLTQEQAQKLADLGAKQSQKFQSAQAEQLKAAKETWAGEAKADKEFGGDKFGENIAVAKKALDTFGNDALKTMLNETGLGNHPEVIRFFVKAGQSISEDRFVAGDRAAHSNADTARVLYGNTTK